ncbi:ankyrin repeat domain-containing protein [Ketobacter sp.]|uniref:ankyrin repeat domain-containing protein n=1 Tax=Ketobacter sp. TaxID=2083498 RepID=UPI0025C0FA64|nr:ankyrin repeat domain-containing protein [Ketobacter sp.]
MRTKCFLFLLLMVSGNLLASEASLKAVGLESTDESGCYLTDGKSIFPTIPTMVAAYDDARVDKNIVLKVIDVAVSAGCDINAPDNQGLSALNAAVLFNNPKLVELLLEYGADPSLRIASQHKNLNGLNTQEFIEYLNAKNQKRDAVARILNQP